MIGIRSDSLEVIQIESEFSFFFFNDTATTEIYTLSLHDALPIFTGVLRGELDPADPKNAVIQDLALAPVNARGMVERSEEHTSELQSRLHLVCRLLLEKKKSTHTP